MESEALLDDVNWKILEELQNNARLSFTELGRRVGLTAPAVAERVRRLEDAGVIEGYRAELNLEKLGLPLLALIRVATGDGMCGQFADVAKGIPEVIECRRVTGGDSYVMKAAVTSVRHLEALLDRLTRYGQTVTSLVLSSPVTHRTIVRPGVAGLSWP
ncbi:MAG: Lrp/AsnC family transcriptional regulator [Chloroflexota bacterium]